MFEDVVISVCDARFHFVDEEVDFLGMELGEDEVLVECFFDLCDVVGRYIGLLIVLDIVLHVIHLVGNNQGILAPPFLAGLLLDRNLIVALLSYIFSRITVTVAHLLYRI